MWKTDYLILQPLSLLRNFCFWVKKSSYVWQNVHHIWLIYQYTIYFEASLKGWLNSGSEFDSPTAPLTFKQRAKSTAKNVLYPFKWKSLIINKCEL